MTASPARIARGSNRRIRNLCDLREKGEGLWSINTAGDLRVIYEPAGKESILLLAVDTRGSLYS